MADVFSCHQFGTTGSRGIPTRVHVPVHAGDVVIVGQVVVLYRLIPQSAP